MASKRLVVHHVTGRLSGIRKIIGHMVIDATDQYPPRLEGVDLGDGVAASVEFAGSRPRYILYRESPVNPLPGEPVE